MQTKLMHHVHLAANSTEFTVVCSQVRVYINGTLDLLPTFAKKQKAKLLADQNPALKLMGLKPFLISANSKPC